MRITLLMTQQEFSRFHPTSSYCSVCHSNRNDDVYQTQKYCYCKVSFRVEKRDACEHEMTEDDVDDLFVVNTLHSDEENHIPESVEKNDAKSQH